MIKNCIIFCILQLCKWVSKDCNHLHSEENWKCCKHWMYFIWVFLMRIALNSTSWTNFARSTYSEWAESADREMMKSRVNVIFSSEENSSDSLYFQQYLMHASDLKDLMCALCHFIISWYHSCFKTSYFRLSYSDTSIMQQWQSLTAINALQLKFTFCCDMFSMNVRIYAQTSICSSCMFILNFLLRSSKNCKVTMTLRNSTLWDSRIKEKTLIHLIHFRIIILVRII